MSTITIKVTELNARRNGEAVISGVEVTHDITLTGTDKQVAWAKQIMEQALVETAKSGLRKAASFDLFCDGAVLDATVAKLNAAMQPIAERLAAHGTSASKWIDNRNKSAADLLRTMMEG